MALGSTKVGVNWVEDKLKPFFNVTDLGEIIHYLWASFERKRNVMISHHTGYCRRVFERFGMKKAKSAPTPVVDSINNLFEGAVTSEEGKTAVRDSRTESFWEVYCT